MNKEVVEDILGIEWEMLCDTYRESGRSPYQDEHDAFLIMRTSQLATWPERLLKAYHFDITLAKRKKRNFIKERTARALGPLFSDEYDKLIAALPAVDDTARSLIEYIVEAFVAWRSATQEKYPNLLFQSTKVRSVEDTPDDVSFETLLRSELETFSPATLIHYKAMILDNQDAGINLNEAQTLNMAKLYGYSSLEEANEKNT